MMYSFFPKCRARYFLITASLAMLLLGMLATPGMSVGADWAIAIHGGAGSDPTIASEETRKARRSGIEKALQTGKDILANGGSSLDAVEAVIRLLEDDAAFNSGRGAVLNSDGKAELDASIMDGATRRCGAIAGVTRVKNPITLARRVMTETKHVLLAAEGADRFAVEQGVTLVPPDYFLSYRERREGKRPAVLPPEGVHDQDEIHYGTVGCVALDTQGHLAAGTSTGGTANKLPGRIGDSPIVGAGTFADDDTVAVSGTGVGEEYIRNAVAYDVSAQMKYAGRRLSDAVTEIMTERLKPGIGGLICVSKDGEVVMQHNTPGMTCGVADSNGRFETYLKLENGGQSESDETSGDEATIKAMILQQSEDWNAGDLDGFMSVYWKSDALTFSSGGQTTRGWDATMKRYRRRYPDKATMGNTQFSELEFTRLDENAMKVLGRWELTRDEDPIGGRFTLIFQKIEGQWKIIHDHTSARSD